MWCCGVASALHSPSAMADANQDSFTDVEEEFFRAGATLGESQAPDSFADLEEPARPRSLWQRLFGRRAHD